MLKALLKKQLLEYSASITIDKKTGKKRSRIKTIAYGMLFALVYLSLSMAFFAMSFSLSSLINTDSEWIYFMLSIFIAISLAVFSTMFYTSSAIYKAKDNDLLLAMPISNRNILISRMFSIYLLAFIFAFIVLLPCYAVYWIYAESISVTSIIFELLFLFILTIFTTSLSCGFGYAVTAVSNKISNNNIVKVVIFVVFFSAYYYLCFNLEGLMNEIIANAMLYGSVIKNYAYPIYMMAKICMGDVVSLLIIALGIVLIFALVFVILEKSFYKLTLHKDSVTRKEYKSKDIKVNSTDKTLLKKEIKHYFGSVTYMLNCSMGSLFMPILGVLAIIYQDQFAGEFMLIVELFELDKSIIAIAIFAIVSMVSSMSYLTAPSISLEGNNLWILHSMPVDANKIFNAKKNLHYITTIPSALVLTICLLFVFKVEWSLSLLVVMGVIIFIMFNASAGLMLNVLKPNLVWTSEVVPIKQDLTIMICLFGGWILSAIIGVGGYFALEYIQGNIYIVCILVLFSLLTRLINSWLATKGATIFSEL